MFPLAGRQTPLSGQDSPVRAVVPIGFFMMIYQVARQMRRFVMINPYEIVCQDVSVRSCMMAFMTESTLGPRIRRFRMAKKLSLQELADAVGASKAHIWDLEQGKTRNPSLALLTALSRELGVSIKEIVGEGEATLTEEEELGPLFRDLRGLDAKALDMIKTMTKQLREMKNGDKPID